MGVEFKFRHAYESYFCSLFVVWIYVSYFISCVLGSISKNPNDNLVDRIISGDYIQIVSSTKKGFNKW